MIRAAVLAVGVAGCASGATVAPPPPPTPGDAEVTAPESFPSGPMRIDLPTVLRLARDRSLDAAFVRAKAEEAAAQESVALARLFPYVGVGARFQAHRGLTQATDGSFEDVTKQSAFAGAGPALQWDLGDSVFAYLASRQRAGAGRATASAGVEGAALRAGEAYLDLVRAEALRAIAEESLAMGENILRETQGKVGAGSGFEGDVLRARARASHFRIAAANARAERARAGIALADALDLPRDVELVPADAVPVPLSLAPADRPEEELVAAALAARPEIAAAEANAAAAEHERDGATWGPLVPSIGADASLGRLGRTFGSDSSSDDYRVTLGWRLGPGGLFDPGRTRAASARAQTAEVGAARARASVVREVRESRSQVLARRDAIDAAAQGAKDAADALDLYRRRLAAGIGLALEAVVAEDDLSRARADWVEATIACDKAQLRLLHAMGRP